MHRFRHGIQLSIILACLIWGGLQVSTEASAQPSDTNVFLGEGDKELQDEYPGLPMSVARAIRSVVATQQIRNSATMEGEVASGVIINDQQILTAGHVVYRDGSIACGNTSVIAQGFLTNASLSDDMVSHASIKYTDKSDLAVLTVQSGDNFKSLPDITIATERLKKGDTVYFINYQPTADGTVRSPAAAGAGGVAVDYSKPVVFSATVIESKDGRVTLATGGGKSYGANATDNLLRKGASGGAIVNSHGELVGLSVSSASLNADHSAASIMNDYHVSLPATSNYQIAYMQPVSAGLVKDTQATTVSCSAN